MLQVTEFNSDFQSVRHKYNQTDLNIINITFKLEQAKLNVNLN